MWGINSELKTIENTKKAQDEFGRFFGSEHYKITKEQIEDLLANKQLAINVGANEYAIFISIEAPKE